MQTTNASNFVCGPKICNQSFSIT
uniref:Uncharacterized protein n=1 Tax=Rhizophora mucronata TaxID=61149 RepID=A0A2P2NWP0_RHIMU